MKRLYCVLILVLLCLSCVSIDNNFKIMKANTVVKAQKPIIVLDAGHGGFDGGAVRGDILEKDINLQFSLALEPLLKAFGYEVVMTRTADNGTEDEGLSTIRQKKVSDIKNRLNLVENTNAECFVSIHQNIFSQSVYKGTQVFYSANNEQSKIYGEHIQESVKSLLQTDNNRAIKPCGKNIYLMYHTAKPAVLIECGFMSNYDELNLLLDENYRNKLNLCILNGILKGRKAINNG